MARGTFAAGLTVSLAVALSSCTSSKVECDCVDTAIVVTVPDDRAPDVESVTPSGPACTGVTPMCVGASGGVCSRFRVAANATGDCHIDVLFSSGAAAFSSDTEMVPGSACCGGFVASPPSGADVEVPDVDGGSGASLSGGG